MSEHALQDGLLPICNYTQINWCRKTDGHAYLLILPVDKSEFKLELCGVDGENSGSDLPIQTEHAVALDPGDVDG